MPGRLLRLRAEMKLPGRSWLEFRVESADADTSRLTQTAFFARRGLSGLVSALSHPRRQPNRVALVTPAGAAPAIPARQMDLTAP